MYMDHSSGKDCENSKDKVIYEFKENIHERRLCSTKSWGQEVWV
jgi:hypothetical protein